MGGDAAELGEVVALEARGEADLVVVVVGGDAVAQAAKVLLLDQQLVDGLVDGRQVGLLHRQQVLLDQRQVVRLAQDAHHPHVVHTRLQHLRTRHQHIFTLWPLQQIQCSQPRWCAGCQTNNRLWGCTEIAKKDVNSKTIFGNPIYEIWETVACIIEEQAADNTKLGVGLSKSIYLVSFLYFNDDGS